MTIDELKWRLRLILSQCNSGSLYALTTTRAKTITGPKSAGSNVPPQVVLPGQSRLMNEQIPLLRVLWSQCSKDQHAMFCDLLLQNLSVSTGAVIAHVLADLHSIRHVSGAATVLEELFSGWQQRLVHTSEHFTENDLNALLQAVQQTWGDFPRKEEAGHTIIQTTHPDWRRLSYTLHSIGPLVTLIRYQRLKAQLLESQNPEINSDREVLISRSAALGFPPELEPRKRWNLPRGHHRK